ncbi:MAG TPA: patatin-like phospholipase family protein [Terriglobales bacterium]|nr:patatin-like phospholipase family protein [Terriglobales bacterium]
MLGTARISNVRLVGILALATLLWGVLLTIQGKVQVHSYRKNPILSIELAYSQDNVDFTVGWKQGDRRAAAGWKPGDPQLAAQNAHGLRVNTYLDFVFIFLYWALLTQIARLYEPFDSKVSWILSMAARWAALFDVGENICIFAKLTRPKPWIPPLLGHDLSLVKWGCFFLALFAAGYLLMRYGVTRQWRRLRFAAGAIAVLAFLSGLVAFCATVSRALVLLTLTPRLAGLWRYQMDAITTGTGIATVAMLLVAIAFLLMSADAWQSPQEPAMPSSLPERKPAAAPAQPVFAPGGGGDDALCFTAGPRAAYFGAGVIHAYLAARRQHPVVVAGISSGAVSAAAIQKCYRELQSAPPEKRSAPPALAADEPSRWGWFRTYLRALTDQPLDVIWKAIPDLSDFFADMPPIRDTSLPCKEETEARRQRYVLIKLGRRLAKLPLSVRRLTEALIYYVRAKERYGFLSRVRLGLRLAYFVRRLSWYICAPVADNFYKRPREDGKEPPLTAVRPLFGAGVYLIAALLVVITWSFYVWAASKILIAVTGYGFSWPSSRASAWTMLSATGALAASIEYALIAWVANIEIYVPECSWRDKLRASLKLGPLWLALWLMCVAAWMRWASVGLPASLRTKNVVGFVGAHSATLFEIRKWSFRAWVWLILVVAALLGAGYCVGKFRAWRRKEGREVSLFSWAAGVLMQDIGLSNRVISHFYVVQKLRELFDPSAVTRGGSFETVQDKPMAVLLVSAALQTLPSAERFKIASQQVWPQPGAPLVEALRAAIAMPGLVEPVHVGASEMQYWLAEDQAQRMGAADGSPRRMERLFTSLQGTTPPHLDVVDGTIVRQNPLPALFAFLNKHQEEAEKLTSRGSAIHVVFNVPLEPRGQGAPATAPANVVDVGRLSLRLAKRRDTKLEVQQTNFLTQLERLVVEAGGSSAMKRWSAGDRGESDVLDTLPLSADCIAPEEDINVGPPLNPQRDKCLEVMAAGCRQSLQRLYQDRIPQGGIACRELMAQLWGGKIEVPDPPGLPEVCHACSQYLGRSEPADDSPLRLSAEKFPQLKGDTPRIAFVASGGVFRGAFQVGVLAALLKANVQIDLVVGASVGTLMGGALAAAASNPDRQVGLQVLSNLLSTFADVDRRIALTATLKSASRELGIRGRSIALSPRDLQRMVRRGSRFDPGFAVIGAPPALLDAISTLLALPYEETKRIAAYFVAGEITKAVWELVQKVRDYTLPRLGIDQFVMGVSLLQPTADALLFPDPRRRNRNSTQPFLDANGRGVAMFATATNLVTWELRLLGDPGLFGGSYDFLEGALSSSAFPAVFQPRRETDIYPGSGNPNYVYADGGMFDNLPFFPAMHVMTSVQKDFIEGNAGAETSQVGFEKACQCLQQRHTCPDLLIAGSLDAEPTRDIGRFNTTLSVSKRAKVLNANLKIRDFEFAAVRVHAQVGRLLQSNLRNLSPANSGFLNEIIDAAVLPIFPADQQHLNPTFAFCRTLGLQTGRIQSSVADGCFQTLKQIARAQAHRPPSFKDRECEYVPWDIEARSGHELRSKSIWGLFVAGKLPYIQARKTAATNPNECPFFEIAWPKLATQAGAEPGAEVQPAAFTCPFAEAGTAIAQGTYFACGNDAHHKQVRDGLRNVNVPHAAMRAWAARQKEKAAAATQSHP